MAISQYNPVCRLDCPNILSHIAWCNLRSWPCMKILAMQQLWLISHSTRHPYVRAFFLL
jgi:hypothetical protein